MLNLLTESLIRIRRTGSAAVERVSLPELFVLLTDDVVASFPALRAHQRFAWHAFLVQLATIALHRANRTEPPANAEAWADLLRALTPDHPDDAPWCLLAPHDQPAFLQAAVPGGDVAAFKPVPSPDALDMLVTSRNHDLKHAAMVASEPDDWLMALITAQTMDGGLSGSYRGIARMNSDYGSRPCVSVRPEGGPGVWFERDVRTLLRCRAEISQTHSYPAMGGYALLWVTTWDGKGPVYQRNQLDPLFIEICRKIRFDVGMDAQIICLKSKNKSLIDGGFRGGITGDPWAPINIADEKIFTISKQHRLGYRQCIDLMDGTLFRASPLQVVGQDDSEDSLSVFAAAMVRGIGKTAGYCERRIPVSKAVKRLLSAGAADRIAAAGHARAELVGKLSRRVLRPALHCLLRDGKDAARLTPKQSANLDRQAHAWLERLDHEVDATFFSDLWQEFETEDGAERERIRDAWLQGLIARAGLILEDACRAVPLASMHRYRARTRAKGLFRHLAKEQFPQLYSETTDVAGAA